MKVGFVSLGCPKNQVDTEVMLHNLEKEGFEITSEDIEADVIIINTCAFIESAKRESIDSILDIAWLKKHRKLKGIVVCGCMAERYRESVLEELPEVDALVGVGSLSDIAEAVRAAYDGKKYVSFKDKEKMKLGGERIVTTPEYTAYLKVAEGCDNRCTFCAIPLIRGSFRSRPMEELVEEARELEKLGVKELNIVAQDTSRYGLDLYGEYSLAKLIRKITENTNIPWIRLLYCYPDKITDELIAEIRDNPRVQKYIDLPIQHISDRILKAMNRHGGSNVIKDAITRLRREIPGIAIRTTAIVGFPGETEEDFNELCEFIKEYRFDRFGAFTYSVEEGTPAAKMDNMVDEQTKQDRYDIIMREQLQVVIENNQKLLGKTITVLVEDYDPVSEMFYGRGYADAPEIDTKIYFTGSRRYKSGEFVDVKVTEILDYDLIGVVKPSK